jgi:hypothetical protein
MDERVFSAKVGQPIPPWDKQHRLPINGAVGPEIKDSATVFRVNSTYMDVSDQPHMMRQWYAGGTLIACLMTLICLYGVFVVLISHPAKHMDFWSILGTVFFTILPFFFGSIAVYFGHNEFFWLKRRPIRFNRETKKIYALRHRRYRGAFLKGDVCWAIPWNEKSIFCIHKGPAKVDLHEHFHIRCYQLDEEENVIRAFAIGREWQGIDGMSELLAQWNYWCTYMNHGPELLPLPLLYLAENETVSESYLYCMYELGFNLGPTIRAVFSPFIFLLTTHRLMAMWTCRNPVWPVEILDISDVSVSDPYAQPKGGTPIGWAATARAKQEGQYPLAPFCSTPDWSGERDSIVNAQRWMRGDKFENF